MWTSAGPLAKGGIDVLYLFFRPRGQWRARTLQLETVQTCPKAVAAETAMCAPNCGQKADDLHQRTTSRARGFTPFRDITCDGSVMAKTVEFRQCDGVMDRIEAFF
jgi:hypothetical protein